VMGVPQLPSGTKALENLFMVNPVLTVDQNAEKIATWEACLSLPKLIARVPRRARCSVDFLNREGEKMRLEANGIHAIVVQHEIDHLMGRLFIDRIKPDDLYYREEADELRASGKAPEYEEGDWKLTQLEAAKALKPEQDKAVPKKRVPWNRNKPE